MAEPIVLCLPSKYDTSNKVQTASPSPSVEWLARTWTVTHSTLSMWRSARNVRITYKPLAAKDDGRSRVDDLVEYEPSDKTGVLKKVAGVDTQDPAGGWNWRGKGWLFFVTSHWELLGWGEESQDDGKTERWAVTWFAPTVFTKEGIDIYSDRAEGISEPTYSRIVAALKTLDAKPVVDMTTQDMRGVEIKLPWTQG